MNGLFHGLDFPKLQEGTALFAFDSFVYALVGLTVWAFALGAVFGRISTWLGTARVRTVKT